MQSFLIVGKDKNETSSFISDFLKKEKIDPIDITFNTYEKAVGIEDIRTIQKAILLKPFRGKAKAVVIDAYENITQEAQNSLLKILEEPPSNTIIIITTIGKEIMLPTIISRCKVISLQKEEAQLTQADLSEFDKILNIFLDGKTGDKLKIAELVTKNKQDATLWLEKIASSVRNKLQNNNENTKYLKFLKEIQITYKTLKSTNVSQRTALENLLLSSESTFC